MVFFENLIGKRLVLPFKCTISDYFEGCLSEFLVESSEVLHESDSHHVLDKELPTAFETTYIYKDSYDDPPDFLLVLKQSIEYFD